MTDSTPAVWQDEVALIKTAAAKYGLDWAFIAAIRKAEGGGEGRQFGVRSVPAPSYQDQLEVCCRTVKHRLVLYINPLELHEAPDGDAVVVYSHNFIARFANIWAPTGAGNDPHSLNANWARNVGYWYLHLIDLEHPEPAGEEK